MQAIYVCILTKTNLKLEWNYMLPIFLDHVLFSLKIVIVFI